MLTVTDYSFSVIYTELHIYHFQIINILLLLRYESPFAPNLEVIEETAVEAFPMAIVGFAVAFSVAKVYSVKHDYTIDGNQVRKQSLL